MTNLDFHLSEIARDRVILLLSKVSGVPRAFIERLETPLTSEELTEDVIEQLIRLAEALEVSVLDFLTTEHQAEFIERAIEIAEQQNVRIERINGVDPRIMMRRDGAEIDLDLELNFFRCFPYWSCRNSGGSNCEALRRPGC